MNILYGVQGTGNGHISRARILAKRLAAYPNVKVQYLFSGRAKHKFFDMEIFGDYLHFDGLTFITNNGKINHLATAKQNSFIRFIRDIKHLDLSTYDLIITDFEPVTAWAARLKNRQILGIGHQYAFGENTPITGDSFFTRLLMKQFAPTTHCFGLHWDNYSKNVLPPIIDTSIAASGLKKHVLVYLPFENQQHITTLLQQLPDVNFIQYSPEVTDEQVKNVRLRKTSYLGFKQDLIDADSVICNSGFELISECLHLGLSILTKPLNGQMEQHSNALALKQLGYATVITQLTAQAVQTWYQNKIVFAAMPLPDVAAAIADSIVNEQWHSAESLNKQLWAEFEINQHA